MCVWDRASVERMNGLKRKKKRLRKGEIREKKYKESEKGLKEKKGVK